jgi:TRAP-type C4-dicarboxylate transport system substrate-binding protein
MRKPAALKSFGLTLLIMLFLAVPVSGAQKTTVIKIATLVPDGSSWTKAFNAINSEIQETTNQAVRFKIYAGGVLGDEKDMIRKMHIGQIHGAVLTSAGLSTLVNDMDVFQIPFLFENYEEVDFITDKMEPYFKKEFEKKGYVLAGWLEGGFIHLLSTKPVATVDNLRKVKVWSWADAPMANAIFSEAQISAIPLSVPDVLVGLQTGLVDVVYAPPSGAIALQWFTKTKYINNIPLSYLLGAVVLRNANFKKLSADNRTQILEIFQKHLKELKLIIRKDNEEAIAVMQKQGLELIQTSPDQVTEFKILSDKAMQKLAGKTFSEKLKNEVTSSLEAFRKNRQ